MTHPRSTTRRTSKGAPRERRPDSGSERNVPVSPGEAAPAQPRVRAQSEQDRQQDRKPVHPEPLLERIEEKEGGKERELRNG
jgi:hypothetical protein